VGCVPVQRRPGELLNTYLRMKCVAAAQRNEWVWWSQQQKQTRCDVMDHGRGLGVWDPPGCPAKEVDHSSQAGEINVKHCRRGGHT
jgi:hypothetical protein